MTGIVLLILGAGLWWFIVQKGDELELSDGLQRGITWAAYAAGALGMLLIIG